MLDNFNKINLNMKYTDAEKLNQLSLFDYKAKFANLALTMFTWENTQGIPTRFIEETLFYHGKFAFYLRPNTGYIASKCVQTGQLNIYNEPIYWNCYSHIHNDIVANSDCCVCRNNRLGLPTEPFLNLFAHRLNEIKRAKDVNISAQKTPFIIEASDENKLTLTNMYKQIKDNEPAIFTRRYKKQNMSALSESFKVIQTQAPFIADKLSLLEHDLYNELYTFLGIDNANTDKRERLVSAEAESNTEQVIMSANSMLKTRTEFCDEVNKRFNLNPPISVKLEKLKVINNVRTLLNVEGE